MNIQEDNMTQEREIDQTEMITNSTSPGEFSSSAGATQKTDLPSRGNIYIIDDVPERNGRVRLIKQRVGDNALQLYFLLPDEEDHHIRIESYDSNGFLDCVESYGSNQCRFWAFPRSLEPSILVKVYLDDELVYERRFRMPLHLRANSTKEPTPVSIAEHPIVETKHDNDADEMDSYEYMVLDIAIDNTDIAKRAQMVLRGE